MPNQRTEAETLARCLEYGLIDVADAVAWADGQILNGDVPHVALCDVAMASHDNNLDVAAALRRLPGEVDESIVVRRLIKCCADSLRAGRHSPQTIAAVLFRLAVDEVIPNGKLRDKSFWFDDAFALSDLGYIDERPEEITSQMLHALEEAINEVPVTK